MVAVIARPSCGTLVFTAVVHLIPMSMSFLCLRVVCDLAITVLGRAIVAINDEAITHFYATYCAFMWRNSVA